MEVLTSNFVIPNIQDAIVIPKSKTLLWVWHADKVPPHIGISSEGRYYSLKAKGKDENLPIRVIESIIKRKQIKTLCFELNSDVSLSQLKDAYSNYHQTIPNKVTCLEPIKNVLNKSEVTKLVDLLGLLYTNNSIQNVFGYNIDNQFIGLVNYSVKDIHSRLQKLSNE